MLETVKKIYQYRILIYTLVAREVKARYRGSIMGLFWSMLNPLLLMLVYYLVFSFVMKVKMENYLVYMFVGLLPWTWFSSALMEGTSSILLGGNMVKKTIFPAEILPVIYVFSNMVNFFLSLPVLIVFIIIFRVHVSFLIFYFPFIVMVQLLFTLGIVFFLSVLNVWFRDVFQLLVNLLNLWFYVTPIIYPISQVPQWGRKFFLINPIYPIISSYQNIFFFNKNPDFIGLSIVFIFSVFLFWQGQLFFKRYQDYFAEEI